MAPVEHVRPTPCSIDRDSRNIAVDSPCTDRRGGSTPLNTIKHIIYRVKVYLSLGLGNSGSLSMGRFEEESGLPIEDRITSGGR
jgi:hypothetical protein